MGKILIEIPNDIHKELKKISIDEGTTVKDLSALAITKLVINHKKSDKKGVRHFSHS